MPEIISVEDQLELVPTSKFPLLTFPFESFNPIQSRVIEFYDQPVNAVIAASTSAGKTVCAELFLSHENQKRGGKGMYIGPLKALAQEKIDDWTDEAHKFSKCNLSICTGDYRLTKDRRDELMKSDYVLMTSEMLNSRLRNYRSEQNEWLGSVGTLVSDECLPDNALIETEVGLLPISKIIAERLPVKVASFNHRQNCVEFKSIINYRRTVKKREWYSIYYDGGILNVTSNHKVWVEDKGYIAASKIERGDVIYVYDGQKVRKQASHKFDRGRKKHNLRNASRRRINQFIRPHEDIGKNEIQPLYEAKFISRLEVRDVKATGWHPAKSSAKQRLWQGELLVFNSIFPRIERGSRSCCKGWCKDYHDGVVKPDCTPHSSRCLVHGRWIFWRER